MNNVLWICKNSFVVYGYSTLNAGLQYAIGHCRCLGSHKKDFISCNTKLVAGHRHLWRCQESKYDSKQTQYNGMNWQFHWHYFNGLFILFVHNLSFREHRLNINVYSLGAMGRLSFPLGMGTKEAFC